MKAHNYRKKPLVVQAIQWTGNLPFPEEFADMAFMEHYNGYDLVIETLEGDMTCRMDDYIIRGVKGEFYPVAHDIFKLTYEKVD